MPANHSGKTKRKPFNRRTKSLKATFLEPASTLARIFFSLAIVPLRPNIFTAIIIFAKTNQSNISLTR
jgi:hypothetical protein